MTILFGTAKTRYPDFGSPDGGLSQLENRTKDVISKALQTVGARIFNSSFVEDGVQSVPGASYVDSQFHNLNRPSRRAIKTQRSELTIILKKRMFSSLREYYDIRFLDDDERIYIKAIKSLFRRKCEQIAFYESLTTMEAFVEDPSILTFNNILDKFVGALGNVVDLGFGLDSTLEQILKSNHMAKKYIETFARLKNLNDRIRQRPFTTWITEPNASGIGAIGAGVGTIEFTMATQVSTMVTLQRGGGKATIQIEDPYRLTRITEADVELALRSALQEEQGFPAFFDTRGTEIMEEAMALDNELNDLRARARKSIINFEFPFGTVNEVFANIVTINFPFTLETINDIPVEQQLSTQELIRVTQIFRKLQEYKTIQDRAVLGAIDISSSNSQFKITKKFVRDKLRREFVGHHIFQQMDSVHIYINSFTRDETPIYANRGDILSGQLIENVFSLEEQKGRISDEMLEQERLIVAPDMTLFEYKAYRNPVNFRGTGNHIFAGLVDKVTSNYSAGSGEFNLSVSVVDNIEYLKMSRINQSPGLTQPQGELEDPLTMFDIETDPSTGLVLDRKLSDQNKRRLPYLRFTDAPHSGEKVTDEKRLIVDTASGDNNSVLAYRHVPGLVYKWKEGIIAATQSINLTRPLSGSVSLLDNINQDFGLTVTKSPFSNLDAADVVSILITGQPHNYNTFIQQAMAGGNLTLDNDLNKRNYFNFLFDFLEKEKSINGNFMPAKASSIDPKITADVIRYQRQLTNTSSAVAELQRQLAEMQDKYRSLGLTEENAQLERELNQKIEELEVELSNRNNELSFSLDEQGDAAQIKIYGNSVQVQYTQQDHRKLRNKLKYILKRKPEEVRYNQDKNYFIVSEKYDYDTDIQAYILELRDQNFRLFESEFKSPLDICDEVAKIIDFELFADTQGNIRFRPPEYNKIPLTLLIKMVELNHNDGINIAPEFLIRLIEGRVALAQQKAFSIELQILEKFLLLGFDNQDGRFNIPGTDSKAASQNITLALTPNQDGKSYNFNMDVARKELQRTAQYSEGAIFSNRTQSAVTFKNPAIKYDDRLKIVDKIIAVRNQIKLLGDGSKIEKTGSNLTVEGASLRMQNAQDPNEQVLVQKEIEKYSNGHQNFSTNRLTLVNSLSQLITERQNNLILWGRLSEDKNAIGNVNETLGNLRPTRLFFNDLAKLSPFHRDEPILPSFIEDLIEDDLRNDDGFNSGKRFIIEDDVILSQTFTIETPNQTRVNVQGTENMVGGELKGANPLQFWAGATDFDSWRQYGYRVDATKEAPFIRNPETQGAPYAMFQLLRERRRIHSGSITIVGNEFYEVGDVVYVTNRQMLYYVESISHTFKLNSSEFDTTLSLSYGHALGEYIPTPLDVIGKTLIANNRNAYGSLKAIRNMSPADTVINLETLHFPWDIRDIQGDGETNLYAAFAERVSGKIANAVIKANSHINKENQDIARVEIRGYTLSDDFFLSAKVKMYAQFAKNIMVGQKMPDKKIELSGSTSILAEAGSGSLKNDDHLTPLALPVDKVTIPSLIALDKDPSEDDIQFRRVPSTEAWAYAVDISYKNNNTGLPINALDIVLVIDKNLLGDRTPASRGAAHVAPQINLNNPDFSIAEDNSIGYA